MQPVAESAGQGQSAKRKKKEVRELRYAVSGRNTLDYNYYKSN